MVALAGVLALVASQPEEDRTVAPPLDVQEESCRVDADGGLPTAVLRVVNDTAVAADVDMEVHFSTQSWDGEDVDLGTVRADTRVAAGAERVVDVEGQIPTEHDGVACAVEFS